MTLEFETDGESFPMEMFSKDKKESLKYKNRIHKVKYIDTLNQLDFYDFLPVFYNEGDVDLMNISKSCWHPYAYELEKAFTEKLTPWSTEEEWRMVNISFTEKYPEQRIENFDLNALKSICFGANTSHQDKERIKNIFAEKNHQLTYYQAFLDGSKGVVIKEIEENT